MEVLAPHKFAAINSGASSHFYPDNYKGERHDSTAATIRVGCANKGVTVWSHLLRISCKVITFLSKLKSVINSKKFGYH